MFIGCLVVVQLGLFGGYLRCGLFGGCWQVDRLPVVWGVVRHVGCLVVVEKCRWGLIVIYLAALGERGGTVHMAIGVILWLWGVHVNFESYRVHNTNKSSIK